MAPPLWLVRFHVPDYGREAACRDAVAAAVLRALQHAGLDSRPAVAARCRLNGRPCPAARPRREALLRQVPLFRDFLPAERGNSRNTCRNAFCRAATTIVRQGEAGRSLFVLAEGALDVRMERAGAELRARPMVPGDIFGEMSLLTGQPRSAPSPRRPKRWCSRSASNISIPSCSGAGTGRTAWPP